MFLDVLHINIGDDFGEGIRDEIKQSKELLVLFTPWSVTRPWVWVEVGEAHLQGHHMVGLTYGTTMDEFDEKSGGKGVFQTRNIIELNDVDRYFA